jgi:uncharacterized protein YrrD
VLLKAQTLKGYTVQASDQETGTVSDLYFSDDQWKVRYVVVDTGPWLFGRRVLISPLAFDSQSGRVLRTELTSEQVKDSPDINLDKPVSRQHETALHDYYGWPYYWVAVTNPMGVWTGGGVSSQPIPANAKDVYASNADADADEEPDHDPTLRSVNEVTGYHIEASDGEIGHVEDFIVDDVDWVIRYLLVDTRNWLPGRRVLISPDWIDSVSWDTSKVYLDITQEQVEKSPEYDPVQPPSRAYEEKLFSHYGMRRYWP